MEKNYKVSYYGKYTNYRLMIDEIEIEKGELLSFSSTTKFPLAEIRPSPSKILRRNYEVNHFQFAASVLGIFGILFFVLPRLEELWLIYPILIVYACLIAGLVLMRERIEYTIFHFLDHTPLFEIPKSGKQKNDYEAFISELIERITYANESSFTNPGAPPSSS